MPHKDCNISFYTDNAVQQDALYSQVSFGEVHRSWVSHLSTLTPGASVLDVGAGNGRDAHALSALGFDVVAVEPAIGLREIGMQKAPSVAWVDDTLPTLSRIGSLEKQFDLILLSGVWMHLDKQDTAAALERLLQLLNQNGRLIITLRHGDFHDGRTTHHPGIAALRAQIASYRVKELAYITNDDSLGRHEVSWSTWIIQADW